MSDTPHSDHIFSEEEEALTLEEMQAYQEGKLSPSEKHAIERRLLNSELSALAYEGVEEVGAETVAAGAAAIAEAAWARVHAREKKRRRGAWIWVSAAAAVALLVTVGVVVFRNPDAEITPKQIAEKFYEQPPAPPPTTTGKARDLASAEEPRKEDRDKTSAEQKRQEDEMLGNVDAGIPELSRPEDKRSLAEIELEDVEEDASVVGGKTNFDLYMNVPTNTSGSRPVPPPAIDRNAAKQNAATNTEGNFADTDFEDAESEEFPDDFAPGNNLESLDEVSVTEETEKTVDLATKDKVTDAMVGNVPAEYGDVVITGQNRRKDAKIVPQSMKTISSRSVNQKPDVRAEKRRRKEERRKQKQAEESPSPAQAPTTLKEVAPYKSRKAQGEVYTLAQTDSIVSNNFEQGMTAYRNGEFTNSATLLRDAANATPANLQAHYYAAASFLNIEQPSAALYHLDRILAIPNNSYYADAEWFKALAYLKMNKTEMGRLILEKILRDGGKHAQDAQKALDEL
ncbi:MAG: hypothetical protein AAGN35_16400 [Bacteroidota bacterium]